jgi:LacI family transcriptional regulator
MFSYASIIGTYLNELPLCVDSDSSLTRFTKTAIIFSMDPHPRILMFTQFYYSSDLHRGIAQYALEAGWSLNASMYRSDDFPDRRWDGVVGCFQEEDPFIESYIKPKKIPAVSLTTTNQLPCVLPDNQAIGTMGAEHLLELGYKNFAFYFWQSKIHELLRADALEKKLNPTIHNYYRVNATKTPRLRTQKTRTRMRVLQRFLEKAPKPIAVMAPLDDLAVEVIELCLEMGLNVPKDVGVLGVNNDRLICDFSAVPLSSVDDNEYKIGYDGARILGRMIQNASSPKKLTLIQPKGVEIRKSTDLLDITDVPDRRVAIAVRFIAENFTRSIKSDDVAAATGISKRPLQDRFNRNIGRSIHEQIIHKRIEYAKKLLSTTDYKTAHVAMESGFGSRERFSKSFKQMTGMSPVEFRDSQT